MENLEKFQKLIQEYFTQLKNEKQHPAKTEKCLEIGNYIDYLFLKSNESKKFIEMEKHIAKCDYCLSQIVKISNMLSNSNIKFDKQPSKNLIDKIKRYYLTHFNGDIVYFIDAKYESGNIKIIKTNGKIDQLKKFKYSIEQSFLFTVNADLSIEIKIIYSGKNYIDIKIKLISSTVSYKSFNFLIQKNSENVISPLKCSVNKYAHIKELFFPEEYVLSLWLNRPIYIELKITE